MMAAAACQTSLLAPCYRHNIGTSWTATQSHPVIGVIDRLGDTSTHRLAGMGDGGAREHAERWWRHGDGWRERERVLYR